MIPTMETNKVRIKSDGSLDKLKCSIVVRGDLQDVAMEDSLSPTAPCSFLKMLLTDPARNRCRVDLKDWLHEEGFTQSRTSPCFFCKVFPDGSYVKLIVYVDDKLFFGNNEAAPQEFIDKLSKRFDVEFLGQAHWYLSARIHLGADFNVILDQARYCKAIVNMFSEKLELRRNPDSIPPPYCRIRSQCGGLL
jgi:hypothetical protein